jgi:hypothetical protein
MPTGYTSDVAEGKVTDLRTFALRCARGMGATVMMRDEPMNAPIPERFEPSAYHAESLTDLRAELAQVSTLSDADAEAAALKAFTEKVAARDRYVAKKAEALNRYNAMLAQVVSWECKAEGLKSFMLDQLHESKKFDCGDDSLRYYPEPVQMDGPRTAHDGVKPRSRGSPRRSPTTRFSTPRR